MSGVQPVEPPATVPAPASPRRHGWDPPVLATTALGGIAGAEGRYGVPVAWPHRPDQLPVATWVVNTSGCLLIGVLMVVVTELASPHRLVRPFLGVGVLGGYTTFSTASVEVAQLAGHGRPAVAVGYLLGTVLAALVAVAVGTASTRALGIGWMRWWRSVRPSALLCATWSTVRSRDATTPSSRGEPWRSTSPAA